MRKILFVLGELHDADLQWMTDAGSVQDVADGEVLIEEGTPNKRLYIVIDGTLSVRHRAREGAETSRMGIGEMAGEISMLDSRPSTATLVADGPAQVFVLEHSDLLTKMERDTSFAAHFYRAVALFLANRLQQALTLESGSGGSPLAADAQDEEELSPEVMDSVSLSGARFLAFLGRLGNS